MSLKEVKLPPKIGDEVKNVLSQCRLMKSLRNTIHLAKYEEWSFFIRTLLNMGDEGRAVARYILDQDHPKWDEYSTRLQKEIIESDIDLPKCEGSIHHECEGCPYNNPLEAGAPHHNARYRVRFVGARPKPEYMDLNTLREKTYSEMTRVVKSRKNNLYLFNIPQGTGKSYTACQVVQQNHLRVLWFAPNDHEQAEEIKGFFKGDALCIYGRQYMIEKMGMGCPHCAELNKASENGLNLEDTICQRTCEKREECEYKQQYTRAAGHPYVILVHAHLNLGESRMSELLAKRDILVIDEGFLSTFHKEFSFTFQQVESLRDELQEIPRCTEILSRWVAPLLSVHSTEGAEVTLPIIRISSDIWSKMRDIYSDGTKGVSILNALSKMAGNSSIRVKRVNGNNYLWGVLTARIPKNIPIFILDSSGRVDEYQEIMGDEHKIVEVNPLGKYQLRDYTHKVQVIGGSYPNSSLFAATDYLTARQREYVDKYKPDKVPTETALNIIDYIQKHMNHDDRIGMITTLRFSMILQAHFAEYKNVIHGHYNKIRGQNAFENVDTLFVVGYQGVEHLEIARNARVWYDKNWNDVERASSLHKQWLPLSYEKHGLIYEVNLIYPDDIYLRSFCRHIYNEVDQAVGRIRPYAFRDKKRQVHIITNVPISFPVDEILLLNKPGRKSEYEDILGKAAESISVNGHFSRHELQEKAGISRGTFNKYIKQICSDLKLSADTSKKPYVYTAQITACSGPENGDIGVKV